MDGTRSVADYGVLDEGWIGGSRVFVFVLIVASVLTSWLASQIFLERWFCARLIFYPYSARFCKDGRALEPWTELVRRPNRGISNQVKKDWATAPDNYRRIISVLTVQRNPFLLQNGADLGPPRGEFDCEYHARIGRISFSP